MQTPAFGESLFIARQPIVDARLKLVAYELLGRSRTVVDGDTRTAQILIDGVLVNGLLALTGGAPAFVNFPAGFLTAGAAHLLTPAHDFVVEVLESVEPGAEVFEACAELRQAGVRVALDDVVDPARVTAFAPHADIVKVDWELATPDQIVGIVATGRRHGVLLLAEKIETPAELELARRLGFDMFQGYLLGRPAAIEGNRLTGIAAVHLRLLEVTSRDDIELRDLEEVVLADPTLTYKVLSYANSGQAAQRRTIRSVREALILYGQDEIRRVAWIVALAGIAAQGPQYVLSEVLTRAHFCDSIMERHHRRRLPEAFLVGLMSGMDMLLGIPIEEAISRLPLPDDLQSAIISGQGHLGIPVALAGAYSHARWDEATGHAAGLGIGDHELPGLFRVAATRAHESLSRFARRDGQQPGTGFHAA